MVVSHNAEMPPSSLAHQILVVLILVIFALVNTCECTGPWEICQWYIYRHCRARLDSHFGKQRSDFLDHNGNEQCF